LFLFFAAILASAWFGGVWSGGFAVLLSIPAGLYFYASSLHPFALRFEDFLLLTLFSLCAMTGGMLSSWQHRADHALAQKAAQLQETNAALVAEMAERWRAEQALQQIQSELARVARLTTMGELTASIAHEINQPLAAIANSAGACMRWLTATPPNLEEARLSASHIIRDGTRAADVVVRVRQMVRKALSEKSELDVNDAITDVLPLLEDELRGNGIVTRASLEAGLPRLMADRVQLQQVFLNLFRNAMDAMMAADRPRLLEISSRAAQKGILVEIADSGPGPGVDSERLFEAFFTTKPNGMGLGLSICRTIIEAHGGSLSAAPRMPHGAVFRILFPLDGE
jgi:C4-dicarboxylate-specific signal transduction histidine kinase